MPPALPPPTVAGEMATTTEGGRRPLVLILGGGFAGLGAARELNDAEADVVLVDQHDYHTFQPLLYQVATDLLETDAVGHPIRDLFHEQPNVTVHQATVTALDLDAARGAVRRARAASATTTSCWRSAPR